MRLFCRAFLLLFMSLSHPTVAVTVLPYPATLTHQEGYFDLQHGLQITLSHQTPMLQAAAKRFNKRLQQQTPFTIPTNSTQSLRLVLLAEPSAEIAPSPNMLEQYQLDISQSEIVLSAPAETGILRGLETLLQLVEQGKVNALSIKDQPRFRWRGLLLDPARRFLPLPVLKRKVDIMAATKLNVLHLHLTDDQGWRFESQRFPRLQQIGGVDGFYSQEQLRQLVNYAAERGIRVVPEIDLPGHTTALGAAYPEFMSQPGPNQPEIHWGVHPAVVDPTNEQLYPFLEQLLAEVAAVFPDPYIHIGGDEVLSDHWLATPHIVAFMQQQQLADTAALQAYFNRRLQQILQRLNRTMIGWDEVLDSNLPTSVLIQSWRGTESLYHAAAAGHQAILSTGYYLDQPQFAAYHYRNDPLPREIPALDLSDLRYWSAWQFSFDRVRGAAIAGQLLLLNFADGTVKGVIKFNERSPQLLPEIQQNADHFTFQVDSWMGPLLARVVLNATLSGQLVVGNAPYTVTGHAIALQQTASVPLPFDLPTPAITERIRENILGGEITLWGELVTADNIDIRLWPNGFAVAERLWSTAAMTDEQNLQQRMQLLMQQLTDSGSLYYQQQQNAGFRAIAEAYTEQLATIAQVLEPAHYYHRLHEKSAANLYHQNAPLNRLVDYLPAENQQLRQFSQHVTDWLSHSGDTVFHQLIAQLQQWQTSSLTLIKVANSDEAKPLSEYLGELRQIHALSQTGQVLLHSIKTQTPLKRHTRRQIQQQLAQAATLSQEMIIALHRPLQQLLARTPDSEIWVAANTFSAAIEGPAVDQAGNLYAVNFARDGTLGKVTPEGKASLYLTLPQGSIGNGIVFSTDGTMYIADYTGHNILRYQHDELSVHAHNPAMFQPNDLAILQNGVIFASDPDWSNNQGQVWRIDPDGSSHLVAANRGTTNGIAISPDQRYLYVNESIQRQIWRFVIQADLQLGEPELFAQFTDYGLDGMRFDSLGNLYVARYGKGTIVKLDQTGQLRNEYRLNHPFPTNVALSKDDSTLYITIQQCGCIERIKF